jgi:hypothetical protein
MVVVIKDALAAVLVAHVGLATRHAVKHVAKDLLELALQRRKAGGREEESTHKNRQTGKAQLPN